MTPKRKRTVRPRFTEATVRDLLDASEVSGLRDEMQEWHDNLEGANMSHLPKFEEVEECLSALEDVADDLERTVDSLFEQLDKLPEAATVLTSHVQRRNLPLRASRSDRLGDCCDSIEVALQAIEKAGLVPSEPAGPIQTEIAEAVSTIRDHLSNLEAISFPGMY